MPILTMTMVGKISAMDIIGLPALASLLHFSNHIRHAAPLHSVLVAPAFLPSSTGETYFPHSPQKHRSTFFPLPVSMSTYFFITFLGSSTTTFSFSIARFDDTYEPATLRQLAQWHRCPRGRVNSSLSLMVTRIALQRHVALRDSENFETSCELGSPVSLLGSAMVVVVCKVLEWKRKEEGLKERRSRNGVEA